MNSNPNIFIFTAGDSAARAHLADSITNPIDQNRVLEFFDLNDREIVSQININKRGIKCQMILSLTC